MITVSAAIGRMQVYNDQYYVSIQTTAQNSQLALPSGESVNPLRH